MSKSIWKKLADKLQLSESADVEGRRRVLKGAASLALMAAVPVGVGEGYRLLTKREQAEFIHRIESGQVIEWQHFLLDRPVILKDIYDVTIRNCTFVCSPNFVGDHMMVMDRCDGFLIQQCRFDTAGMSGTAIQFNTAELQA